MKYFIFVLILFSASITHDSSGKNYLVIWNVGQGQFVSFVSPLFCHHFDMGGEFFPWKKILSECQKKDNEVFLSHWDWDHIGALNTLKGKNLLNNFCIALRPLGNSSQHKMKLLEPFPSCPTEKISELIWKPPMGQKDSNSLSQVVKINETLIPGDSPVTQEKIWSRLNWIKSSRVLILGHHGSKTSTSTELLQSLPYLKMSISSARWKRYHHPDASIEARLQHYRIPLLKTEEWGNIWIEQ
ncbi:MAG: hydrolase [Bdellovibrio sp.]